MRIERRSLAPTLATALVAMLLPLAAPVAAFEATSAVVDQGRPVLTRLLMRAWILQVRALTPGLITVPARNSLVAEANLWIQSN